MAVNAGDAACTTGMSQQIYTAMLAGTWPAGYGPVDGPALKAMCYAIALGVCTEGNSDSWSGSSGGGVVPDQAFAEAPDGVRTTFTTVAQTRVMVFQNGRRLRPGSAGVHDYYRVDATHVTFNYAPPASATLAYDYQP